MHEYTELFVRKSELRWLSKLTGRVDGFLKTHYLNNFNVTVQFSRVFL